MGFELLALALMATVLGVQHALLRARPYWSTRAWDEAWSHVRAHVGLADDGDITDVSGVPVRVSRDDRGGAPLRRIVIDLEGHVPESLSLVGHTGPDDVRTALFGAHTATGDEDFDARYVVLDAADCEAVAALRPAARERWLAVPDVGLSIDGALARGIDAPVHSPWTPERGGVLADVVARLRLPADPLPASVRTEIIARVGHPAMQRRALEALRGDGRPCDPGTSIRKRIVEWSAAHPDWQAAIEAGVVEGPACPPEIRTELAPKLLADASWGVRAVRRAWQWTDLDLADAVFRHAPPGVDVGTWPLPDVSRLGATIAVARATGTAAAHQWLVSVARRAPVELGITAVDALAARESVDAIVRLRQLAGDRDVPVDVRRRARERLHGAVRRLGTSPGRVSVADVLPTGDLAMADPPGTFTP